MKLNYAQREIFWGNEALIVADLAVGTDGKIEESNHKIVTGLVSVGAMEDQAETANFPADDVPDHGVKKGATLLQGEMVFIQTDQTLKEDMLGQERTANGLGWSPTGNWKTKCVQYLIKGRRRTLTGAFEDGWRVVVYPNLTPTAEATKESETDSVDGVDPIQWTLAVQATDSDIYLNNGKKVPSIEYEIWGDQAKDFANKMEGGLFIMMPDTVLAGGIVVPDAPTAVTGKFETNGDITLTWTGKPEVDKAYVTHYGDANKTIESDLKYMGYSETTSWTLKAADVPTLTTGDTINLHVQAFDRVGQGADDIAKAAYLNGNASITGSAWSEPAVQLTKA